MAKTQIILAVNGNRQMTDHLSSEEFDVSKKLEYEFSEFVADDGVINLPINKLNPISKILASSTGSLNIKYYTTESGVYSANISGLYYNCVDPFIAPTISGLTIETTNTDIGVSGYISIIKTV